MQWFGSTGLGSLRQERRDECHDEPARTCECLQDRDRVRDGNVFEVLVALFERGKDALDRPRIGGLIVRCDRGDGVRHLGRELAPAL